MSGFTPQLPLTLGNQQGYNLVTSLKDLVRQNFLMLLLTNPGERIMDSEFGVGIKTVLFENFGSLAVPRFEQRLRAQVAKYMPYVVIRNIDYTDTSQDNSLLSVKVFLYIIPLGTLEDISIDSGGRVISITTI